MTKEEALMAKLKKPKKSAFICYLVAFITMVVQLIIQIIVLSARGTSIFELTNLDNIMTIVCVILNLCIPIMQMISVYNIKFPTKSLGTDYLHNLKIFYKNSLISLFFTNGILLLCCIVYSAYFYGFMGGVAFIPRLVGLAFYFVCLYYVKKELNVEQQKEDKRQKALALEHQKEEAKRLEIEKKRLEVERKKQEKQNLVATVGTKFFVKYYYYLKNWLVTDIEDLIEENYSGNNKLERIQAAKKIFNEHYELEVLEDIIKEPEEKIDSKTQQLAQEILEKEKGMR
jgi:uncharacterized membrane protein